jgi:hypothetical protein
MFVTGTKAGSPLLGLAGFEQAPMPITNIAVKTAAVTITRFFFMVSSISHYSSIYLVFNGKQHEI